MNPVEDIIQIILDPKLPDRLVDIGSLLEPDLREDLVTLQGFGPLRGRELDN